ncbi:hypothetical protein TVAG_145080 [Trichomonas vaginalis G3]|uniref:Uncharacterized protein n=1 Tax=Trichomonas vaginalis (strain ATCC PRA-98 / G3) TaxID=412133 RepID=A2G0C5_TRIV3|nr:hypothetical protein TVAGG3_0893630 [Trichomonas vaginalis G3]EAX89400.1 hypothetical protein TVAG_145080 [Trichomonas vaginalis G3]KAI5502894.1 hypothetical protein TVAGG3_0893630 [Trichomonas vaginalis G3]|eukprot:XP_001302330.1 hypothetical protein [Trichomonas vaginalis G3]
MSYGPSAYELVEFRQKIKGGSSSFDEVILNFHFSYFWNRGDPELLDYIIKNAKLVFNSALFLRDTEKKVILICKALLTTNRISIYPVFMTRSNFFNFYVNFAQKLKKQSKLTQDAYFEILRIITQNATVLFPSFKTKEYIDVLVSNLDIVPCYDFLTLLGTGGKESSFLKNINFLDMIVDKIVENSNASYHAQNIIIKSFDSSLYSYIINSLMLDNKFAQIIDNSIQSPNPDTFEFLRLIIEEAEYHFGISNWKRTIHLVDYRLSDFIKIFTSQEQFTKISKSVCSLTLVVLKYTKRRTADIDSIFYKLCTDFFKYKCNTFLHNTFLKFVRDYKSYKLLDDEMLKSSHLFEMIIQAFETFDKQSCSYWGQLYEIAKLVNPYFKSNDQKTVEEWKKIINYIGQANKIMNSNYGGRIPFVIRIQRRGLETIIAFGLICLVVVILIYLLVPSSR